MYIVHTHSCINIFVCTWYIHVHELIYLYVDGTYTFMNVNICMHIVQTRLYSFTTTLHFPSGPICFATQVSLQVSSAHLESYPPGQDMAKRYVHSTYIVRTCLYMNMNIYKCMKDVHTCSWFNIFVCTWYLHVHEC